MKSRRKKFQHNFNLSILMLGVVGVLGGVALSPDLLLHLGFFKQTLTFDQESVIQNTLFEIKIWKALLLFIGVSSLLLYFFRKRIVKAPIFEVFFKESQKPIPKEKLIFTTTFKIIFAAILLAALYVNFGDVFFREEQLKKINLEGGGIEDLSALLFLVTSIAAFIVGLKLNESRIEKRIYFLLAALFFFIAGEEISWGQRILGLETIEVIKEANVQGENNIHNLFGYFFDHAFIAGVFLWGFVVPFLCRINLFARGFFNFLKIPVASLGLALGFLVISLFHDAIILKLLNPLLYLRIAELREFLCSIAFLLLISESWKLTTKADEVLETETHTIETEKDIRIPV